MVPDLDIRPVIVAIAGPNGAGKSTFYESHIRPSGLRFVNADVLARELRLGDYEAAELADHIRRELVRQGESFAFETVFSDPVGDKIKFLKQCAGGGYNVILCFIGLTSPKVSRERVAIRVTQGGHDVPAEKIVTRFPRTLDNLRRAVRQLPRVMIYDNSDLRTPYRLCAEVVAGKVTSAQRRIPTWLKPLLPSNLT